jgi:hypothetical protein
MHGISNNICALLDIIKHRMGAVNMVFLIIVIFPGTNSDLM